MSYACGFRPSLAPRRLARHPKTTARPRKPRRLRFAIDAVLGAALMVTIHMFVLQVSIVRGSSMEPCLLDGDRLVVDRVSYSMSEVERGDVVVLRNPRNHAIDFVKRVVGLPGDEVEMRDGDLFVNGEAVDHYGCIHDHHDLARLTVPSDNFFVLGDNRPVSCDSRDFGLVAKKLLKGRVRVRFWPLQRATVF